MVTFSSGGNSGNFRTVSHRAVCGHQSLRYSQGARHNREQGREPRTSTSTHLLVKRIEGSRGIFEFFFSFDYIRLGIVSWVAGEIALELVMGFRNGPPKV